MNDIGAFIDMVEAKAANAIKPDEGDYIEDGLLFCGKCHTKKQTRINILGKERTPFCLCKCEVEKRRKEEDERKRIEFLDRVKTMRKEGFCESEMQDWTFAHDDGSNPTVKKAMSNYVDKFDTMRERGKGLLLFGTVGTGKTFSAACVANALIDKGIPCLMTNFSRLTYAIQGMYNGKQEYIDSLNHFPLLVIDDLAAERNTEYMDEIVFNVIDSRYRAGLPLIVTTNLTAEELKRPADIRKQRIYSRLFEMCIPLEVKGIDRRRERLKDDISEMKTLLGI